MKAVRELRKTGWLVYRVKGSTKFNRNVDIFTLFDICAKKNKITLWLQIKSNRKPVLTPFEDFKKKYCCKHEKCEVWVYKDYKGKKEYRI